MDESTRKKELNRRSFLKLGLATATMATVSFGAVGKVLGVPQVQQSQAVTPVYRVLGRTGLKVTVVSFGAMLTPEHEVMRAALDLGVNYIDTARKYMNGRNEEIVGRAIKGIRDKLYIATKTLPTSNTKQDIIGDVETSLSKLQTDHIDVIQLHSLSSKDKDRIYTPEVREALLDLRKQGKVRFFGVTTHTNQAEVLGALIDDKDRFFDTALVGYNVKSPPDVKEAIARAAKAGIGIIAMKTQAGGYKTTGQGTPHQAALKWVLQDANVTCAIPGMKDVQMLSEDLAVMGMKLTRADERMLDRYSRAVDPYFCRFCAECEPGCPHHVAISVINRSLMYAEGYGHMELARETYREIPVHLSALACLDCRQCAARCVNGIDISGKMARARSLLS